MFLNAQRSFSIASCTTILLGHCTLVVGEYRVPTGHL